MNGPKLKWMHMERRMYRIEKIMNQLEYLSEPHLRALLDSLLETTATNEFDLQYKLFPRNV